MFYEYMSKKDIIHITSRAWSKMGDIINSQSSSAFLFSAESGGCNGLNYKLKLINNQDIEKIKLEKTKFTKLHNNDVQFYIDPLSEMFLIGTKIDWVEQDYPNGVFENKFIFKPDTSIARTCGCGISFTPIDE